MKKFIIGISALYHDSSVCLFKNGELVFACEEEKFTGIKHDSSFPVKALSYIFKKYKIKKDDVESVCYYEDLSLKLERVKNNIKPIWYKRPLYSLKSYLGIKKNIKEINKYLPNISDNVFFSTHHESHLYYSFYTSHFNSAICLSIDGVGEVDTMSLGITENDKIEYMSLSKYPHSLGLFYSAMTSFLGFKPNEGEYKVMGLASYGNPNTYIDKVRKLIKYKNSNLECNLDVFTWHVDNQSMFNDKLGKLMNMLPRIPDDKLEDIHMDLAAAVQMRYEEILFQVIKTIKIIDKNSNLCLSGGCAYNGTANGKIVDNTHFNSIWIPPAPSDAGSSIGACINYMVKNKILTGKVNRNPFLGPIYFSGEIQSVIKDRKYRKFNSDSKLMEYVAKKISEGNVVGWFQGHCEFGSRALGNRSILADPTDEGMKDRINKVIKKREGFRPFAPMVIKDKQDIYFEMNGDIPYMNQVVKVKPEYQNILKAVTHVDGTSRVQTVHKNTLIYQLLLEFEKLSGYPILLNTSFNVKDKTMVLTPKDAIDTFYNTDLDILVIENFIIEKNKNKNENEKNN